MKRLWSKCILTFFSIFLLNGLTASTKINIDSPFLGEWTYEIKNTQIGDVQGAILLKLENTKLAGVLTGGDRSFTLYDITVNGNVLTCAFDYDVNLVLRMTLESKGDSLAGTIVVSEQEKYSFTANKKN